MNSIGVILGITLMYSAPLVFAAMGGVISEKAGVINIGIEGMMTFGAFTGAATGYYLDNPWIGFLCAALAGGAISILHAVACVNFHANQTISGVALNLIGTGASLYLARILFDGATQTLPLKKKLPKLVSNADGTISLDSTAAIAFILVVLLWLYLYRTKGGLRLMAAGEHPEAVDSLGISVEKIRFCAVIASGILAGAGGAAMSLAVVSSFSQTVISGHGYIALAAVIFGRWNPASVALACLLFGFSQSLVVFLGNGTITIPSQVLAMLPYVVTIIVLIVMHGETRAPKASGVPYEK